MTTALAARRLVAAATKRQARLALQHVRSHHPDPMSPKMTKGWKAALKEADIPTTMADKETAHALEMGLPGASSIEDKTIPTFSRGELPHFAGINTFLKAPYVEDARNVGDYDATVVGVPFDGGCTYRAGTRFGPQGIRRISALYTPYNYEKGIDLRESMTLCDAGDIFTIPANLEKSFDQISNGIAHIASTGTMPIILGGDHSIGFPTVRGIASVTTKNIGIIHVDRHADIQEKDLDERMHTTPYFHATNLPNVNPKESGLFLQANLVQIGIGGWQVPRPAVPIMVERETNIFTMDDIEHLGIEKVAEMALELAWDGCDAVYMSYDIDSIEAAFVPGTGWPEPGGLLPREALKLVGLVAKEGLCGMEVVEVSPPYDHADITSLMALRIVVDALGAMVSHGTMGNHKSIIDKEFTPF
ncbi:Probable agmatinase 2 [Seminavis robusta]|uniref:Probable agmatinase 2 n=1 Tax=Seminavis robusta TaxID=568900 RepID=A0A9N8DM88_9STRA|nr:Probable agmatinase 2 [Seminavis robusta]|eukprot:Sro157_g071030.1 Probable agmatinase 2 (417) ;mRNA; r:11827-13259